jgi:hypothetical protein
MGHFVIGATEFEGKNRLVILSFEKDLVAQTFSQFGGELKFSFSGYVIDAGR